MDISNEKKATEIAEKHKQQCYYAIHGDLDNSFEECYQSAIESMEWKENQIFNLLRSEVLSAHLHGGEIDEVLAELDRKLKGEEL